MSVIGWSIQLIAVASPYQPGQEPTQIPLPRQPVVRTKDLSPTSVSVDPSLNAVRKAFERGDYEEAYLAVKGLVDGCRDGPGDRCVSLHYLAANISLRASRLGQARSHALSAIRFAESAGTRAAAVYGLAARLVLSRVELLEGDADQAEVEAVKAHAGFRALWGGNDPYSAFALGAVGAALQGQGRYAEAEQAQRAALRMMLSNPAGSGFPAEHVDPALGEIATGLGSSLKAQGRWQEADASFREALRRVRRTYGSFHPQVAIAYGNRASSLADAGSPHLAEAYARRAMNLSLRSNSPWSATMAPLYAHLAFVLFRQGAGRMAESEEFYRRALLSADRGGAPNSVRMVAYSGLAAVKRQQGAFAEEQDFLRRALASLDDPQARARPTTIDLQWDLGRAWRRCRPIEGYSLMALAMASVMARIDSMEKASLKGSADREAAIYQADFVHLIEGAWSAAAAARKPRCAPIDGQCC